VCRHYAYVGREPVALEVFTLRAPHSLLHQARAARLQSSGTTNPDGFGVGWFAVDDPTPHRYRRATPIWDDHEFPRFAAANSGTTMVGAVRLASPGAPVEESGNAPFVADGWLFSLNGTVDGFHDGVGDALRAGLSTRRRARIEGHTDTEVVFALALDLLDAGASPLDALRAVTEAVDSLTTGHLNLLLADRQHAVATARGNSLFTRPTLVASEPFDDDPDWVPVPDGHAVVLRGGEPEVVVL
jgi:glutamine amidotransferase